MKKLILITVFLVFALGWCSSLVYSNFISIKDEFPYFHLKIDEKVSPYDWIKENQIHIYKDKVVIDVSNLQWASYANTNSMDPVLDYGANGLEIIPGNEEDIHVGDVVSYESSLIDGLIVHRVVEINEDDLGLYYITKGDNNTSVDPEKIRFNQVKYVLVGVIY